MTTAPPLRVIDLNADLGEGGDHDEDLLAVVTSANISCGTHAGDPALTARTAQRARALGVRVGAHPSYPDRENFGRVSMAEQFHRGTLEVAVAVQFETFRATAGVPDFIKPHGALYNDLMLREDFAFAIIAASRAVFGEELPLVLPPRSAAVVACEVMKVPWVTEAFPDRAYLSTGVLAPRTLAGAVLTDAAQVTARAVQIATTGKVSSITGRPVSVPASTLCLHGDSAGAHTGAMVREALADAGVEVTAWAA